MLAREWRGRVEREGARKGREEESRLTLGLSSCEMEGSSPDVDEVDESDSEVT